MRKRHPIICKKKIPKRATERGREIATINEFLMLIVDDATAAAASAAAVTITKTIIIIILFLLCIHHGVHVSVYAMLCLRLLVRICKNGTKIALLKIVYRCCCRRRFRSLYRAHII